MNTYTIKLLLGTDEIIHTTAITLKEESTFTEVREAAFNQMLEEEDQTCLKETYGTEKPTIADMEKTYEDMDYTLVIEL